MKNTLTAIALAALASSAYAAIEITSLDTLCVPPAVKQAVVSI